MADRLLELLKLHSVRFGRFTLTSGKESDFFVDCKQTVLLAEGHVRVGDALCDALAGDRFVPAPVAVAGVELGGCPLASAVALTSFQRGRPLDALYVRKQAKDHGTARLIEGGSQLPAQSPVVLVEDVITTGGSTLKATAALRGAGFRVVGVLALVDRDEGGADALAAAGLAFHALYRRRNFQI